MKRRSVRVSLQTPNQHSTPGTHPYQTGPEIVHIVEYTGVCVCVCVGINYRFVPRVKVMQSAILSK